MFQNVMNIFYSLSFWEQVIASLLVTVILYLCGKVFWKKKRSKAAPSSINITGDGNIVGSPGSSSTVNKK